MAKTNVHDLMKSAINVVSHSWDPHAMLGAENAQVLGYAAVVGCLHELPATLCHMVAGLHAMDGPLVKIRQGAIPASLGWTPEAFNGMCLDNSSWKK